MSYYDAELVVSVPIIKAVPLAEPEYSMYTLVWPYDSRRTTGEEVLATLLDIFDNRKFTVEYKVKQVGTLPIPPRSTQETAS